MPGRPLQNHFINGALRQRGFTLAVALLVCAFATPLWKLFWFAANNELFSYILLIPWISLYLFWLKRATLLYGRQPARSAAALFFVAGGLLVAAYWLWFRARVLAVNADYLMIMTISFLLLFYGIVSFFWGTNTLRTAAFPLGFLILATPFPPSIVLAMDSFLQKGSAWAAAGFFSLAGTPFLRDGLTIQLPDIRLSIAPECSGIHSTLVLFITALLLGHVFLRTPWKRMVLVLFVVPLGLLRNGFRVFVIGQLCIHWGPRMIDSQLHRKGGPIFFVLSLVPLFLLLFLLFKSERPTGGQVTEPRSKPCAS